MTLPRLLTGVTQSPMSWERHLQVHGEPATNQRPEELLAHIKRSGLRGRGGGSFPMATKMQVVKRSRGTPILLVNGCEGEPMSAKDRLLLVCLPHLVIDGALAVARAVGADEILCAVDELNVRAGEAVQWALTQRPELRGAGPVPQIFWTPSGIVSGQESALVRWCNEGIAKPVAVPPRVTERGISRRPTLVANVETLAHVALIARHGGDWFHRLGTAEDPGSALVTVTGAVRHPGVYEIELGSSLGALLASAGGEAEPARAFLVGGYAGAWIDATEASAARLGRPELAQLGTRLGAGIVVALPRSACPVAETTRVAGWLADQSAGQCGPCVNGLASIADELADVGDGSSGPDALGRLQRWCELATGRGACAHPDGTAAFVASALRVFAVEFLDHMRHGPCDACDAVPVLNLPGRLSAAV
jgi:NADH:ubiquinone oxidoreductase subunit F (NADH-binding)